MSISKKTAVSFSKAFEELESITQWFEQGEVDLEEALKRFERGLALVKLLQGHLKNVENKVVEIKKQFGKTVEGGAETLEDEEDDEDNGKLF